MKKKIANALELALLAGSFIILNIACVRGGYLIEINGKWVDGSLISVKPLELMSHYSLQYYPMLFLYAVIAIMCIISIVAKKEHRDGKLHASLPVFLFLLTHWNLISLGEEVGNFVITGYDFPTAIFEVCMIGVVVIGFAKRSTLIAGLPKTVEVKQESTKADELKKYKELLDSGAITQEEYDAKKKELLG